ncbi:MAG: phosphotransferase [Actinobacteria bacterium]|nr:phosphotransferase [Actinomycetota bacterium]
MTIAINVEELRERPHLFVPHLDGVETVETVEVLQAHYERAVLKLTNSADGSDLVAHAVGGTTQSIVDEVVNYRLGPGQLGLIHGDAQPGHFFVDDGCVQAIDLADWTVGDIAFDLAVLTLDETNRLDELLLAFDSADRKSIAVRVGLYSMLRLATEIRWFDEHDFDPTQLLDRLGSMTSNGRQPR